MTGICIRQVQGRVTRLKSLLAQTWWQTEQTHCIDMPSVSAGIGDTKPVHERGCLLKPEKHTKADKSKYAYEVVTATVV